MKHKTMVEIYSDDKKDLHYFKIATNAKNLPEVLHYAIEKLKEEMKNGEPKTNN